MLLSVWLLPDSMVSFSPDVDVLAEVLFDRRGFKRGEDATAALVTTLEVLLLWIKDLLAAPLCHVISRLIIPLWVSGCCIFLGLVSGLEGLISELHFWHRLRGFWLEQPDEDDVRLWRLQKQSENSKDRLSALCWKLVVRFFVRHFVSFLGRDFIGGNSRDVILLKHLLETLTCPTIDIWGCQFRGCDVRFSVESNKLCWSLLY